MTLQYKRRFRRNEKSKDDKLVTLNVSGRRFVTWESTLKKHPSTLLGSEMLSVFFDKKHREYFLDRDPHMFRYILNFYRVGKLHMSSEDCNESFKDELNFYGICTTELEPCCWEDTTKISIRKKKRTCTENQQVWRSTKEYLWNLLEGTETSTLGIILQTFIGVVICLSTVFTVVETTQCSIDGQTCLEKFPEMFSIFEAFCVGIFTLEYIVRLYAAKKRLAFVFSKLSIIDLMAFIPFYIDLMIANLSTDKEKIVSLRSPFSVFRILRIMRMLKLSRLFRHMRVIGHMLKKAFVDLGFLFFAFFLANVMFSSMMFYIEYDEGRGNFTSIPDTMWYTVVTMMTLGYGDMVPVTVAGKILGSLCCLMGILMLALPTTMMQKGASEGKKIGMYSNLPRSLSNTVVIRKMRATNDGKTSDVPNILSSGFQTSKKRDASRAHATSAIECL